MKKRNDKSPHFGKLILRFLLDKEEFYQVSGDLEEVSRNKQETQGSANAIIWYWVQVFKSLPSFVSSLVYWRFVMFKSFISIAFRNIKKHKGYSFINITGLSIGLLIVMLISPYIRFELSYDNFHERAKDIYRIHAHALGRDIKFASVSAHLAQTLKEEFPEVEFAARVNSDRGYFKYKDQLLSEARYYSADPDFLKIFTFPLIIGDKKALEEPFALFITRKLADKYFKGESPLGKTFNYNNRYEFTIKGVLENIPENSYLQFDLLISMSTLKTLNGEDYLTRWISHDFNTFVLLKENADRSSFEKKLNRLIRPTDMGEKAKRDVFYSRPFERIYIGSGLRGELEATNDIRYLYLLSIIAVIILLIACLNYITLSTARAGKRAREIGIRKVVGAGRPNLIRQFMGESILFSIIAFAFSVVMVSFFQPLFNNFMNKNLRLSLLTDMPLFLGLSILVGILAGLYPALFLSSFQPVTIFRGVKKQESKPSTLLRRALVVTQFVITIALIACTLVVHNQLNFMQKRSTRHLDNPVLIVQVNDSELRKNHKPLLHTLNQYPRVLAGTASYNNPLQISWGTGITWHGEKKGHLVRLDHVDFNYIDFFGLKLKTGRKFLTDMSTDKTEAIIINETAAKDCPWEDPLGKRCKISGVEGVVVGIVEDFHFKSLYQSVEPLAFRHIAEKGFWAGVNYISLKISSEDMPGTIKFLEDTWSKFSPYFPFFYVFQDDVIAGMYRAERRLSRSFIYFTLIAIFLASIGLFGLTSFTTERRNKEIGIRKVLGASLKNILFMLSKEMLRWIVFAAVIAFPIAYFAMNGWLQKFAYRIHISLLTFAAAAAVSLTIAILAMSYQSVKVALTNPVNSLRND